MQCGRTVINHRIKQGDVKAVNFDLYPLGLLTGFVTGDGKGGSLTCP